METEHSQGNLLLNIISDARLSYLGYPTSLRSNGVALSLNLKRTIWVVNGAMAVCGCVLNEVWRYESKESVRTCERRNTMRTRKHRAAPMSERFLKIIAADNRTDTLSN